MYLDHGIVDDKCNVIVDCYVTKGNVQDSEPYQKRKEHVERSFADSKQNHGYRYAMYKGDSKELKLYMAYLCCLKYEKHINKKG